MNRLAVTIILFLGFFMVFTASFRTSAQPVVTTTVVGTPAPPVWSMRFSDVTLEVRVVNSTYAEFSLTASIRNLSNQTILYVAEVVPSTPYRTYYAWSSSPLPAGKPSRLGASFGAEIVSERYGKLNVTNDGTTTRATSSIEPNGDDRIRLDGWMILTSARRMIWREYVEDYVSFSIRLSMQYEVITPSEVRIVVKMLYPVEYTRTDETNYKVEVTDGYKMIGYSDYFYGGYGLSFNLYKDRVPFNSLIVFLALWTLLIVTVVRVRIVTPRKDTQPS